MADKIDMVSLARSLLMSPMALAKSRVAGTDAVMLELRIKQDIAERNLDEAILALREVREQVEAATKELHDRV